MAERYFEPAEVERLIPTLTRLMAGVMRANEEATTIAGRLEAERERIGLAGGGGLPPAAGEGGTDPRGPPPPTPEGGPARNAPRGGATHDPAPPAAALPRPRRGLGGARRGVEGGRTAASHRPRRGARAGALRRLLRPAGPRAPHARAGPRGRPDRGAKGGAAKGRVVPAALRPVAPPAGEG